MLYTALDYTVTQQNSYTMTAVRATKHMKVPNSSTVDNDNESETNRGRELKNKKGILHSNCSVRHTG